MRMFHRRVLLLVLLASLAPEAAGTMADQGPQQLANASASSAPKPTVVYTRYIRPARVLHIKTHFTPWAEPTVAQVYTIINIEAARAHISVFGLIHRISCESGFRWWAANGQYHGLGQFAQSTFNRGVLSIGSRRVYYVTTRWRAVRVKRIRGFSDGTTKIVPRWRIRQRIIHIHNGTLPRFPALTDGWTQVRVMAEAIAGRSAVHNSEWQCST